MVNLYVVYTERRTMETYPIVVIHIFFQPMGDTLVLVLNNQFSPNTEFKCK